MALVRGADTKPEMVVRRALFAAKVRYRLHARDLPGRPDISVKTWKLAIFVHGCFWHRHDCASGRRTPKSNIEFWRKKFDGNVARDRDVLAQLKAAGWTVLIIWECETRDPQSVDRLVTQVVAVRQSTHLR